MEKIQIIQILELHKEGKMDDKTATDLLLLLCNSSSQLKEKETPSFEVWLKENLKEYSISNLLNFHSPRLWTRYRKQYNEEILNL